MQVEKIVLLVLGLWLLGLTVALWWVVRVFNSLTRQAKGESLIKVLEKVIARLRIDSEEIREIKKEIAGIRELDRYHIQKVGMVRFNPFRETGGDHSFSIALLDANNTGLILTGIHTRERTRIYTKAVKLGEGEFELSDDEKKALSKAQKTKV
ncbi:hypothetical protein A3E15_01225 [Candidatus Woesebacteria bacterium RIFCSPHIGHO2_12_FULL_42_9]|uniref:DUF4446 domain-containing protein n=3 Tax=Candidatus Woeseibacteriota TaxID=1752722 RepID=A0A1F8ATB3_9BACT|nr:MAG: hypothetical protein UT23_C0015G0012 [Candidatus Woesebacteria bacterium GW2011_GWA1_39_12]OGM06102.1 MAG: hypothetical protein A2129_00965 [Candidatus Woesebacteria bacterium GWC1_42_13]OGM54538.1 MAG: hypothetical protein A3E15_01225 [Candidatus Woesebacteria bacterium RIFCSPHIGHO2_12_FULL_42_9]